MVTPEQVEPIAGADSATDIEKCPSCGADMVWSPEDGCLRCEHCGSTRRVGYGHAEEMAFERLLSDPGGWSAETHVFRCDNCGALEVIDRGEIAKACSFCGATNVVETDELPGVRPNAVVPFELGLEGACASAKKWAKRRIFAPRAFKKALSPEAVRGVYSPAFSFDTDTVSYYSGRLVRYRYETHRVNGKTVTRRVAEHFNISGTFDASFDDILVQASSRIDDRTINKLSPFGTNDSRTYGKEFLGGFTAEHYSKDGMRCWQEARSVIRSCIKRDILARYTYDLVESLDIDTDCNNITYKYLLLPVWVGHFGFHNKVYNFFVNGRTGKTIGRTPVSPLRVGLAVLLGAALLVGLSALIMLANGA